MSDTELRQRLAARFREVNGDHPMSAADDAYVSEQFAELEAVCAGRGGGDAARRLMLEDLLPLPGYLRSDGAEMVPRDLFSLADEAGGVERLEAWFTGHWADPAEGKAEWAAYLSGQYVCLHSVSPATIRRKDRLTAAIAAIADTPGARTGPWAERLHALVDELDRLEPAFCGYDRLRFGGPTSRDLFVDAMRARFPRPRAAA
ncbi:DUF6058 family natural product biosynthesis protein [Streptomyces koyangensis]|uniref:Uncharacterized protein n=1 Tax=Streptomyces koyangensis TaxID=188770 RepID=A0A385D6P7_9ACTN|nr:DUF6058 family natural product biosynthesis protein [Streptomyces koyangensis]AXQ53749.1 hypothetical protein D0C37_03430 [Streptomyces koyangensis]